MTTIATDGLTMAGDGLITGNGLVHGSAARKVIKLPDGRLVGVCGTYYGILAFANWMTSGGDKPDLPESFEALVLAHDGCTSWNDKCQSCPQEVPAVTGSGGALALGAMLAGCSPAEAVSIASQRDIGTGGTIIVEVL